MPEGNPAAPAAPSAPVRPRTAIAWCVVAAVVTLVLVLHAIHPDESEATFAREFMTQQVQVQYGTKDLVSSLGGGAGADAGAFESLERTFGRGPLEQRQRFATVAGDMRGPAAALLHLDGTERLLRERGIPLEGTAKEVQGALHRLYRGTAPSDADAALLRRELGWFGDLALAPHGSPGREAVLAPARDRAGRMLLVVGLAVAALGAGVVAALFFWIAVARSESTFFLLGPGAAPHGIYAETFAAWMVLFVLVSLAAGLLGGGNLAVEGSAMLLTLGALAWPVLRGVPFSTVRDDLGLRLPPNPLKEIAAGAASWLTALPAMAAALVVVVLLAVVAGAAAGEEDPLASPRMASHPIMGEVAQGDRWLLVLFLAAGVAPVVEEVFFRGALYRHLRDATGHRGRLRSVAISAAASGFVFAVIHPQGLVAVPLLVAVSWALVQAREWRGYLLAPVAAHSLHNGLVTLFLYLTFGS